METIPPSGFYYPNKIARIFLMAMEEIMGKNGLNAVLNMAKQPNLIDNYPLDNLDKQFDFAQFSALNGALEEMYGPRGGRGLALRAPRPLAEVRQTAEWVEALSGGLRPSAIDRLPKARSSKPLRPQQGRPDHQ